MLLSMAAAFLCVSLQAQEMEMFPSMADVSTITSADYFDPEEFMVGPGDMIWISFPGGVPFAGETEAVSVIVIPVGLDGCLCMPGMAPLDVEGMNLFELQETIKYNVRSVFGRLSVSSGLSRAASFEVPVTGQVGSPGIVAVNGLTRLEDALEAAGGPTATAALSRVLRVGAEGDSTWYDLNDFLLQGRISANPLMERNTRLHVFPAVDLVIVEGSLTGNTAMELPPSMSQAVYETDLSFRVVLEFVEGETAVMALQRAGGISFDADLDACFIRRKIEESGAEELIPFNPVESDLSPVLQAGDRLVVPSSQRYINVVGQVNTPQPVLYSPGMNVNYYIGMAGGFTATARQNGLKLIHANGVEQDVELTDIVPPGAMVEVPRVAVQFWQEYLTILTGVATVVISYQSLFN